MSNQQHYWKGYEELENEPGFVAGREKEFAEDLPMEEFLGNEANLGSTQTNRRDFLKFLGFGVTAATLAACETPVNKAIPYLVKPETITPGVPNYYASTYYDGRDYCPVVVKTREGRPIKLKGNPASVLSRGGSNARVQGSILGLYDGKRAKTAMKGGKSIGWSAADKEIAEALKAIGTEGKKAVLMTNTLISPSTRAAVDLFLTAYPQVEHIAYDAVSYQGIRLAHQQAFGKSIIPHMDFAKARSIVGIGADFLNGWLNSCAYESGYAESRSPENPHMSRHFQFETVMSLAGSNADYRSMIKASQQGAAVVALYNAVAEKTGNSKVAGGEVPFAADIARAAKHLLANKGHGLVVCGLNDLNAQYLVARINQMLGNYGSTLSLNTSLNMFAGNDAAALKLTERMKSGEVQGVILYGVNPGYSMPDAQAFNQALAGLKLSVSFADRAEESPAQYLLPDHHYLESWNDFEAVSGHFSVQQPTIHPLFDTRQAQETLMVWAGQAQRSDKNNTAYREFMKARWVNVFNPLGKSWDGFLYEGCWQAAPAVDATATPVSPEGGLTATAASAALAVKAHQGYEVVLYEKVGMGWGNHANNPILQELPDPISRVTWDNYITMAPADMDAMKLNKMMGQEQQANVVKVSLGNRSLELPVLAQPGQAPGSIGIALGYGRLFGRAEQATLGANAFPFMGTQNGVLSAIAYGAKIDTTASTYGLAGTQTHHTMMGRDIIKETSLKEFKANAASGNAPKTQHTNVADLIPAGEHEAPISKVDYWREFKMINHRWGMSIDLNSCTGCGACVVSCHVENNVPVVGKDEVRRSRDMHWLRIDRYYTSDADPSTRYERGNKDHVAKEIPSANPRVAFQPVMCQHCNHAPCETVCPVLATTHSTEGLNQMTYNRCVGTRYCANNCPYKVRRFNWFSYHDNQKFDYFMNDDLGKMVLNPDVTVRARGVMEKCSLCVQRIQAGKLTAKSEGRMVADGEVQTACAEACPTNAIVFGDFNDEKGKLTGLAQHGRSYYLLEEVGVKPNIVYQTKVRNVDEAYGHKAAAHHGAEHTGHEAGHEKGHEVGKEAHSGSGNESHSEHKSH